MAAESDRRFIVERISDGKFLELDLPITPSSSGPNLCAPAQFKGTVAPDVGGSRDEKGALIIDPGASYLHEEADGVIRNTWLVSRSEADGDEWEIEGDGFSSFLKDRPFEGEFRGINVDMADVVRHLWTYVQRQSAGNIGVTVVGTTGVRRGTDSDEREIAAKATLDARKKSKKDATAVRQAKSKQIQSVSKSHDRTIKALQATSKARLTTLQNLRKNKASKEQIAAAQTARNNAVQAVKNAQAAKKSAVDPLRAQLKTLQAAEKAASEAQKNAQEAHRAAAEKAREDGGAWKILWWDTPDCFREMEEALEEAGFEWYEWSAWNADKTAIRKEIRIVRRVGKRRDDIRFVEGENVVETVVIEDDTSEYANAVVAIGAGEGRKALRVSLARADGRRRKVHVIDAKNITKRASLEKIAQAELARRLRRLRVDAIRVDTDHPHAERGTFGIGDTVPVDCGVGWMGRQVLWHRIVEIDWESLNVADLTLEAE